MEQSHSQPTVNVQQEINLCKSQHVTQPVLSETCDLSILPFSAIKKSTNNTCWRGCGEKGTHLYCWWECKLVQPLWTTVWRFLEKLEIELPYDPAIPLLGTHTEETRHHRSTVYNTQDMEATKMSIGRRMDKKAVVLIHDKILLSC